MGFFKRGPSAKDQETANKLVERGRKVLLDGEDFRKAVGIFDAAFKKDPKSVGALEGMAFVRVQMLWNQYRIGPLGRFGVSETKESALQSALNPFNSLIKIAEKELSINPNPGFALRIKAFAYALLGWWYEDIGYPTDAKKLYGEAQKFYKQERNLNPGSAFAPLMEAILTGDPSLIGRKDRKLNVPNMLERALNELKPWS